MKTLIQKTLLAASLSALTMTSAFAATDGVVGETASTGTSTVTFTVENEVLVTDMQDIDLAGAVGADRTGNSDLCIYTNSAVGYNLTATGSGAGSAFEITDGTTPLAYTVDFDGAALASGTATGTLTDHDPASTCGTATGNVVVTVASATADAAGPGAYTGVLTLVVAPE